jgi:cysteine sulfinate desulfinase/cysteine desulfurase-like protein
MAIPPEIAKGALLLSPALHTTDDQLEIAIAAIDAVAYRLRRLNPC